MRQWRDQHKGKCSDCGNEIDYESKRCVPCNAKFRGLSLQTETTIGEYRQKMSVKGRHPSWLHAHVRGMARHQHKKLCVSGCMNCGYSKHVEICHIIALADWPDETLICAVNASENILILCRNCHWELDHDLLTVGEIRGSRHSTDQDTRLLSDGCQFDSGREHQEVSPLYLTRLLSGLRVTG